MARPDNTRLVIALLLWFFLGSLCAHRFYLGKVASAIGLLILQVVGYLTTWIFIGWIFLGIFWLIWLFDLFQILTGRMRPNDGTRLV